jgi:hypothetical protein
MTRAPAGRRLVRLTVAGLMMSAALGATATTVAIADLRDDREGGRRAAVVPAHGGGLTGGELLAESSVRGLVWPAGANPAAGGCITLARGVLYPALGPDGTSTCTATRHDRLMVRFGSICTNVEDPPYYGKTEAEQLACAIESDRAIEAIEVAVDGRRAVDIVRRRFEVASPQRAVQLPAGNNLGVPAGPATFTAHGWAAMIRGLRPGLHTVTVRVVAPAWGEPFSFSVVLDVRRG